MMLSSQRQHLSCGALTALAQSASLNEERFETHLEACSDCKQVSEKVQSFSKNRNEFDFEKLVETLPQVSCDDNLPDLEKVDGFFAFLTSGISEEIVTGYFNHVNHCLPCLMFFATNWSDYMTIQNDSM